MEVFSHQALQYKKLKAIIYICNLTSKAVQNAIQHIVFRLEISIHRIYIYLSFDMTWF